MIRNKQFRIRMTNEEFEDLDRLAKKVGLSKSSLIRHAITTFEVAYDILKRHGKETDEELKQLEKSIYNISLSDIDGKIILSGKNKGFEMREKLELDKLETIYDNIVINIDSTILSFNASYFLALFKNSKNKLKTKQEFLNKYKFEADKYLLLDINDNIDLLYNRLDL